MTVTTVKPVASIATAQTKTFAGNVTEAGWDAGSGAHMPGAPAQYTGLFARFTINPSFKVSSTAKVDNKAKTITVTLKNDQGRPNHAADVFVTRELGLPNNLRFNAPYTLIIKDAAGHVLNRSKITTMPAA